MDFKTLPKIELHLHLDCSLSYSVVSRLHPGISEEEFRRDFIAGPKCTNLADYITRAESAVKLMQTKESLRMVTLDLFDQLSDDHVIYAEIRFAPLLHIRKGLSPVEVVECVNEAVSLGIEQTGVQAGLILCTLRHYSEEESMATVKLADKFRGTNVCGFDIAADEAGFPVQNHIAAFQYANRKKLNVTAHAGEACGAESVWETLKHFKPSRIGHGVRSLEDEALVDRLKRDDIHLEVCPTSNIQTNVFDTITDHNIDRIYNSGISMGVNTDGRTVSNVTLTSEYALLEREFGWTKDHLLRCNLEAVRHAFASDEVKEKLKNRISKAYS
jgi:adenosine deaminase